jgi:hypothetical protein
MFKRSTSKRRWLATAVATVMALALWVAVEAPAKSPPPPPKPLTAKPPRAHVKPPHGKRCSGATRSYRCTPTAKRILAMQHARHTRGGKSSLHGLAAKCRAHRCARHRHGRAHPHGGRRTLYSASATSTSADTLNPGATMTAGQYLTTANGQYKLVMQGDGNLVLYTANLSRALWASNTANHPGARVVMQGDGNLVIYGPSNEVLFASNTAGRPGASLVAQTDGNVVIYSSEHQPLWASNTVNGIAGPGDVLTAGQYLTTANGQYKLVMQGDGNLVLYTANFSRALWNSRTQNHSGARTVMQGDGNLVIYGPSNEVLFASNTAGRPGSALFAQTDGNVVLYNPSHQALWNSGTVNWAAGPNDVLYPGWFLTSMSYGYRLVMQADGNLVMYRTSNNSVRWHAGTNGNPGARAVMQGDGNFVVYTPTNVARFNTGTAGHPGSVLAAQGDGNLVVYEGRRPLWWIGTDKYERAIQWALSQQGSQVYNWLCAKFVANAYGAAAYGYNTAWDGARAWGVRGGNAPRGTLVFFRPDQSNGYAGHVGISLGDGRMVSAESNGVRVSYYTTGYWGGLYAGWNYPPASWPGR